MAMRAEKKCWSEFTFWEKKIVDNCSVTRLKKQLLLRYIEAFSALNDVGVHNCFGKELHSGWKDSILKLRKTIDNIFNFHKAHPHFVKNPPRKYTLKLHILFDHVIPWIERTKRALGWFSEQSFESAHHDFHKLWTESYKISDMKDSKYGYQLRRRCVLHFASSHVPQDGLIDFLAD